MCVCVRACVHGVCACMCVYMCVHGACMCVCMCACMCTFMCVSVWDPISIQFAA